jgi:SAM-dependent methyltransferase
MPFTGERLTSEYGGQTRIEHLHRYLMAREWCRGKDVLDVASGEGYGTALLAQTASSATGVELAQEAVDHANMSYAAPNLRYIAGDARALPVADAAFDVVVSFETIEHFAEQDMFVRDIRRVLRPGGVLIVSTPDRDNYSPAETPANPYHVQELTDAEFAALLHAHFTCVCMLLQRPIYGSVLMPAAGSAAMPVCFERRGDHHFEASSGLSRPQYRVAFASDQPIAALAPSVYVETGRLGLLSPPEAEARFLAAERAQNTAQAEQHRMAAELARAVAALDEERAQIEAYGVAARERAAELEALRGQLAQARESCAQDRLEDVEALRSEVAGLQGEVKGLLVANGMAERAFAALGDRIDQALSMAPPAGAAPVRLPPASGGHGQSAGAELAAARAEAEAATALARSMALSTSWRVTAPLRAISRTLLRRR